MSQLSLTGSWMAYTCSFQSPLSLPPLSIQLARRTLPPPSQLSNPTLPHTFKPTLPTFCRLHIYAFSTLLLLYFVDLFPLLLLVALPVPRDVGEWSVGWSQCPCPEWKPHLLLHSCLLPVVLQVGGHQISPCAGFYYHSVHQSSFSSYTIKHLFCLMCILLKHTVNAWILHGKRLKTFTFLVYM